MADKPSLSALLAYYNANGQSGLNGYQKVAAAGRGDPSGGVSYEGGSEGGGGERYLNAGGVPDDEQSVAAFNAVKAYDPDVRWEKTSGGGNEGGGGGYDGYKLMYDESKLPQVQGRGVEYVAPTDKDTKFMKGAKVYNDEYGTYANNNDIFHENKTAWWEYAAPLLISMVAPMAGAALMASGVGLGAAGTAAATSAAAGGITGGMAAADAAAAMASGAGAGAGAAGAAGSTAGSGASWGNDLLAKVAMRAPTIAKQAASGNFGWEQLLTTAAGVSGIPYAQFLAPALALGKAGLAATKGTPTATSSTTKLDPRLLALIATAAQRGR